MIEAIVISFIVGLAALHVAFKLSPKPVQRKMRDVVMAGLNKIGLHAMAHSMDSIRQSADKACASGCDGCGIDAAKGSESNAKGVAKVVRFYPRAR